MSAVELDQISVENPQRFRWHPTVRIHTVALIGSIGHKKNQPVVGSRTVVLFRASAVGQPSLLQSENETPSIMISRCRTLSHPFSPAVWI